MASNGNGRGGLLTAGGVLSIVAGVFLISSGLLVAVIIVRPVWDGIHFSNYIATQMLLWFLPFVPQFAEAWWQFFDVRTALVIVGACVGVLGIVALAGGISSIRRKSFGLSLAGAICALPSVPLGVLAVIFIVLGRRESRVKA